MNKLKDYKFLFLDRDGVINVERKNDYVKNISEMIFEDGALKGICILKEHFDRIFVITNQRGVGRGVMTNNDLDEVHEYMISEVTKNKGKIDKIYYCTDTKSDSINRKPNIGMAFQAQAEFPEVDLSKSIMVGNSRSDIDFGNKLGMYTVLVGDKYKANDRIYQLANIHYANLYEFALSL